MTEGTGRSFKVLERLGQGAFGSVYLAETGGTGLARRVALKVPNPERVSPAMVARLRDEARLLSLIRHRAIVRVDDLVELDGVWTVVMEYIEGSDVAELLQDGPIPPRPSLAIAEEVAQALHAAYHQATPDGTPIRLLHRDIKPSNLRITSAGEVKILDFGVARAEFEAKEASHTSSVLGTTTYLAPERYHGEDSRAGDVYALGVTLFEMLTGVPPGKSAMDADRQPPGRKWADQWKWIGVVHGDLKELIAAMLAMQPEKRPSAREVARRLADIRAAIGGVTLEDWAERTIPKKLSGTPRPADDRTGSILIERSTTRARVRAAGASPMLMVAGGIGLVALLGLAAALGAAWQSGWGRSATVVTDEAPSTAASAAGEAASGAVGAAVPDAAAAPPPAPAEVLPVEGSPVEGAPVEGAPGAEAGAAGTPPGTTPGGEAMDVLAAPGGTPAPTGSATPPAGSPAGAATTPAGSTAGATTSTSAAATTSPSTSRPTTTSGSKAATTGTKAGTTGSTASSAGTPAATAGGSSAAGSSTGGSSTGGSTSGTSTAGGTTSSAGTTGAGTTAAPPTTGRLVVAGDVSSVSITGPKGAASQGNVAPGAYTIRATLSTGEQYTVGPVNIAAGQTITVRCSATMKACKALGG